MADFQYLSKNGSFQFYQTKKEIANKKGYTKHSLDGFYSSTEKWLKIRKAYITKFPFCCRCEEKGIIKIAVIVNHIKPVEKYPELKYDWDNLESVCDNCHRLITIQDRTGKKEDETKRLRFEKY